MPDSTEQNLALVTDYAKKKAKDGASDYLKRYAATSAEFAALGGAIGTAIPIPGVGTAMGALVGAGAGLAYEVGRDVVDALFGDEPRRVKEPPEKAEQAYYTYMEMGGEEGTGLPYPTWWGIYVQAGRPDVAVLKAARDAEKALRKSGVRPPPPPTPPPPKVSGATRFSVTHPRRVYVLVESPSGMVHAGNFIADPKGAQGFRMNMLTGEVESGNWRAQ